MEKEMEMVQEVRLDMATVPQIQTAPRELEGVFWRDLVLVFLTV